MIRKICFVLYMVAMAQLATAKSGDGNILTGEAKVDVIRSYNGSPLLAKPEKVIVQDFTPVGDITRDESAAARLHRNLSLLPKSDDSTPESLMRQVQATFSKTLIKELTNAHIQSERAVDGGVPLAPAPVLMVEGEFIAINEGNESKRVMIGFGRGASDIKTHVVVSSVSGGTRTVLLEFNLNSASGKKPGAVAGMGSLAVGAAVGGAGDKKEKVQADASRTAKAVAKQIEAFMKTQKWISPASN